MTDPIFGPPGYDPFTRQPPERPYSKWQSGATAFGVIAIVAGSLVGCGAVFTPLSLLMAPVPSQQQNLFIGIGILAAVMYATYSTALIWWGVGSIKRRRWVRPLALVPSTILLAHGLLSIPTWLFILPSMMRAAMANLPNTPNAPQLPGGMISTMVAVQTVLALLFGIGVPGAFVLFYRSTNVKAMLESLDPIPRWTDRYPIPVLGVALVLAVGCLGMAMTSAMVGVMSSFAPFPYHWIVLACGLALAVILFVLARMAFQIRAGGWMGALVLAIVWIMVAIIGALRPEEMFIAIFQTALPKQQAAMMHVITDISIWSRLTMYLPMPLAAIVYLLCIRRLFRPAADQSASTPVPPPPA